MAEEVIKIVEESSDKGSDPFRGRIRDVRRKYERHEGKTQPGMTPEEKEEAKDRAFQRKVQKKSATKRRNQQRNELKRQREEERAQEKLQKEKEKRIAHQIQESKRLVREQVRYEAQQRKDQIRAFSGRRRAITDVFGAFGRPGTGRRINHAIDFVAKMFGADPRATAPPTSTGGNILHPSQVHVVSGPGSGGVGASSSASNAVKTAANAGGAAKDGVNIVEKTADGLKKGAGSSKKSAQAAGSAAKTAAGRAGGMMGLLPLGIAGAAVAGALVVATTAVAGFTAAIVASSWAFNSLVKQIGNIPSAYTFARVDNSLKDLALSFQRAAKFGDQMARVEKARGEFNRQATLAMDEFREPLLEVAEKAFEVGAEILQALMPFFESTGETLGNFLSLMVDIVEVINDSPLMKLAYMILENGIIPQWVKVAASAYGFFQDQDEDKERKIDNSNTLFGIYRALAGSNTPFAGIPIDKDGGPYDKQGKLRPDVTIGYGLPSWATP